MLTQSIEIVRSSNPRLNSLSDSSAKAILATLTDLYANVRQTTLDDAADLEELISRRPDLVFLGLKYLSCSGSSDPIDTDRLWVAEQLDKHSIGYTGSDHKAHRLENDKALAKQRVAAASLNTSPYCVIRNGQLPDLDKLNLAFPLFVKPTQLGGGEGIDSSSVVLNYSQLVSKLQSISQDHEADALVEEYLPGREFSVAILQAEMTLDYMVWPIELIALPDERGSRLLSQQVKSANTEVTIAVDNTALKTEIMTLAVNAFRALGGRDYGRIDIRLDKNGRPQFLEANLIPSLIDGYGSFPKACQLNGGLVYRHMILQIVRLALERSRTGPSEKLKQPQPLLALQLQPLPI